MPDIAEIGPRRSLKCGEKAERSEAGFRGRWLGRLDGGCGGESRRLREEVGRVRKKPRKAYKLSLSRNP